MQPSPPLAALPETLLSDAPVTTQEADEFQRYPFAQRIAATIRTRRDAASLVLGLYGKWGSGKTSVLHFIEHELAGSDIITMVFNPWLFSGEEQLLLGFFAELGDKLAPLGPIGTQAAAEAIQEYSKKVAARAGVLRDQSTPELGRAFEASAALEGIKQQLRETLRSTGKRILVLIDDIDRLDKHEIQSILRLVKLTGDFAYTTYLLAFDEAIVARAVGDRYPGGGIRAGRRYLEKIIQVPLHVPVIQREVMSTYFERKLTTCLALLDITLSTEEMQRVASTLAVSVLNRDITPRDINRYINTLSVVLPMLRGEAHMGDLVLIEAVKIFYPVPYKAAASQQKYLTGATEHNISKEQRERYNSVFGEGASNLGDAKPLFMALFPLVASVYKSPHFLLGGPRIRREDALYAAKSIASSYYFKRYFSYAVQPGEIPDNSFAELRAYLKNNDRAAAHELAAKMIARSSDREFIRRLQKTHEQVAPAEAAAYCNLLIDVSETFSEEITQHQFAQSVSYATGLLLSYLSKSPADIKLALCQSIVEEAAFSVSGQLLFDIRYLNRWRGEISEEMKEGIAYFTPDIFLQLTALLVNRALHLAAEQPLYQVFREDSNFLFAVWQQAAGSDTTGAYLQPFFEQDPTQLNSFFRYMVSTAMLSSGFDKGVLVHTNIDRDTYHLIAKLINADYLYEIAQQLRGDTPLMPYEPRRFHVPSDEERLHQFIYLHDTPEEETIQDAVVVE